MTASLRVLLLLLLGALTAGPLQWQLAGCIKFDPVVDIGGDAGETEYPFMVQLQRYWAVSYLHQCGGSLLQPRWIVTAAHCNQNRPRLQVLAGTVRRNDRTGGQRRAVVRFVAHERYVLDGQPGPYDIALAEVEEPFVLDGVTVATIGLPVHVGAGSFSNVPEFLAVMGYGKTDDSDTMPALLQVVVVDFRTAEHCGKVPAPVGTLCVGSPGSTACQGDSGGPVVGLDADGITRLVGVVSHGSPTCGARPITCTDVAAYQDWIVEKLATVEEKVRLL